MFPKVMLKLLFLFGTAAAFLLTAVPFISASYVGQTAVYLPIIRTSGLSQNQPPIFSPITATTAIEDIPYTFMVTAVDPDEGDQVTIIADQKPAWLSLHPNGNGHVHLMGTPLNEHVGVNFVALRAVDLAGDSNSITFTITVINANDDPYFEPIPPEGLEALEDMVYVLTVTAVDPDGDEVTIVANEKPDWLTFQTNGNGQVTLTGTPLNGDVGANFVELTAFDSALGNSNISFTITVIDVNDAPELVNTIIPHANEDMIYVLDLMAVDPDGDMVTITVNNLPIWLDTEVCGVNCLTLEGTPTNEDVGVYELAVALDDGISPVFYGIEISVINTNDAPYFVGTSSFTATIGVPAPILYVVAEDLDPTQDPLTISELSNLPNWLTVGATVDGQAQLIFNDTDNGVLLGHLTPPGIYFFTLQAADNHGGTAVRTYQLTILNNAPQFDVSQVITEVTTCPNPDVCGSFVIPVIDNLGDVITLTVTLPNGEPINVDWVEVAITNNNRLATLNLLPRPGDEGESVTLWVRAIDSAGASAEYTFTITVITP